MLEPSSMYTFLTCCRFGPVLLSITKVSPSIFSANCRASSEECDLYLYCLHFLILKLLHRYICIMEISPNNQLISDRQWLLSGEREFIVFVFFYIGLLRSMVAVNIPYSGNFVYLLDAHCIWIVYCIWWMQKRLSGVYYVQVQVRYVHVA